jgi:hypothetical protein
LSPSTVKHLCKRPLIPKLGERSREKK